MNDKEILSEHGRFWLSENDERKLWGTLRINEINEVRLETFGSLISERDERKRRIIGVTGLTQAAATTVEDGDRILKQLSDALRKAGFG